MARQRGRNTATRRGASTSDPSAPFSSSSYSNPSAAKPRRSRPAADAPRGLHDVYDFAQASTSAAAKPGRGARRATAGMHADDYDDLPSQAKGKLPRRRRDGDDDDDDEESDDDDDDKPIGPKVFDSDDELNAGIEGSDEELDSDEAFGESDDEKFDGWTFGRRNAKPSRTDDKDSDDDQDADDDQDDADAEDGMMDLSRMLDAASDDSDDDDDQDDQEDDDEEDSSKLQKHIDTFAAGSKRHAGSGSDDEGSDAEPSAKRSRRVVLSERTEAIPETEFAATHSGSTLRLEDFMSPLSGDVDFADVRKSTKLLSAPRSSTSAPAASKKGGGALSAPLPSVVQDRLDRQGAYATTRDEVQGWQPTINRLRDAEHVSFPLQAPARTKASTSGLVATFTPDGEMEASVAAMLESGGLTEKQLAEQEDLAMNRLDPAEARARRDELRRMRMLLFRAEQKAKRVAKIKSKTYRKLQRKDKERLKAQLAQIEGSDAEQDLEEGADDDERLKAERDRARERATLKHKNTSKWARNILSARHGEHNAEARREVEAQLNRGAELRAKIHAREVGDDSDDDDDSDEYAEGDAEDEGEVVKDAFDELEALELKEGARRRRDEQELERAGGKKGVYGMKFMKDARERQYAGIRGDVDDFVSEMRQLGAEAVESDDEDAVPTVGQPAEAANATYVQGNKGRAMYGAASASSAPSSSAAVAAPRAAKVAEAEPVAEKAVGRAAVDGGSRAGVEVGGSATRKKSRSLTGSAAAEEEEENPWLVIDSRGQAVSRKKNVSSLSSGSASAQAASKSALRATKSASRSASALAAARSDEVVELNPTSLLHRSDGDSDSEDEPMVVPRQPRKDVVLQRSLVASAFAHDDVVADFAAEKQATVDADASKTIDTRLPGWGSWTGKGTRAPRPDARWTKTIKGVEAERRKDAKMANVIIAERRDKKQDKFTRNDLPYPYTSVAQYRAAMNQPLGKEWNTLTEKQRLNLPRVATKPGKLITPVARKF